MDSLQGYTLFSPCNQPLWYPVFGSVFPLRFLPVDLLTLEELKEAFWEHLSQSPVSFFDFWCSQGLDIHQEFQQNDGGFFKPVLKSLRHTLISWEKELRNLEVLRIFQCPPKDGQYYYPISLPLSSQIWPVHYQDKRWISLQEMVPKSLGKYKVPLSHWYQDLLLTMPQACKEQGEWRWIRPINRINYPFSLDNKR